MSRSVGAVLAALAVSLCSVAAPAADIAAVAVGSELAPEPRAQALVDATLKRHAELAHVVLHVTPPGAPDAENVIIASSMGRIGKRADADDLRIMHTGEPEAVVARSGDRYNVALPLLDRTGRVIGVVGLGFHYQAGDDQAACRAAARKIRDELRGRIRSAGSLFAKHR